MKKLTYSEAEKIVEAASESAHEVIKAGEPTEMAGVAEAETQAAYAWALDYDDPDEFPTQPTQRLTSRRITSMALAASLAVIATAGAVALGVEHGRSEPVLAPVAIAAVAVLDGTYRFDSNFTDDTSMGSPNPPLEGEPQSETSWRVFRSTCTPAGCTATETVLDDTNHQIAMTPLTTHQWRFINGRWHRLDEKKWRETRPMCTVDEDKIVEGDETILGTVSLEPQSDGSLRGLQVTTVVSSECGEEGIVRHGPFTVTRVGDVPLGVVVADPSTVSAQPTAPAASVAGPLLDGTYRFDFDYLNGTFSDGSRVSDTSNESRWFAFQSRCTVAGCVATEAHLDDANHQEPTGLAAVFHFTNGHWVGNEKTARIPCDPNRRGGATTAEETVTITTDLVPQPDGTLRGVGTIKFESNECSKRGVVNTIPIVGTRTGPVPPNVVLADPALFA